ncbi:dihydrofolate reductase [Lachnospiraceae bacterium KH1T2]|jgi:dihydrofolate reductase|nr:dihydrofolate reductase [Lachnospiraceae bacterium KH1T2]
MIAIVAADANWGIGLRNDLLVRIPSDQKFFRETTTGKVVVMGRKTLESFPGKKPLPNRVNIVLTRNKDYAPEGVEVVHDIDELNKLISAYDKDDVYLIGGASIYKQLIGMCDKALVTKIDKVYEADTYFPNLDADEAWEMIEESDEQTYFDLIYHFCTYIKKN